MHTHLLEERAHESDQVPQRQIVVGNYTLNLMELSQVGRVHGFVPKHSVNGEVTCGTGVLGELVQHCGGNGSRVRAQHEPEGFGLLPRVAVAKTTIFTLLMHFTHVVPVLGQWFAGHVVAGGVGGHRVGDVKGILEVAGRMLLRDEEGVEIPEAGFDETGAMVSWC